MTDKCLQHCLNNLQIADFENLLQEEQDRKETRTKEGREVNTGGGIKWKSEREGHRKG